MRGELDGIRDEDLLKRSAKGDERAFTTLMRRHEDRVFAITLRITGDRSDALDATQEAFISAFRRAPSFRGESSFSTWIYRIAANAAKDVLRKRRPLAGIDDADERAASGGSIEEQVGLRIDLARALAQLSDDYREAVALHDIAAVPYDEIARITGVSIGTVKSRISRGRRRLAELLEQATPPAASKEVT